MQDTRTYILQKSIEEAAKFQVYSTSLPDDVSDAVDVIKASGHIATENIALKRQMLNATRSYEEKMGEIQDNILQQAYRDGAKAFELKNPYDVKTHGAYASWENKRDMAGKRSAQLLSENPDEFYSKINSSDKARYAKMEKAVQNLDIAIGSVNALTKTVEEVYSIANIVNTRIQKSKSDSQKVRDAHSILDQAYRIQKEGTERINGMMSELDKLNESFFGNIADKIKNFFSKMFPTLKNLKARALAL